MTEHAVRVHVDSPVHFDRTQLLLRVLLAIFLGWLGITAGWLACALFGVLPIVAAISISSYGAIHYANDVGPRLWGVLAWLMRLWAFMILLVDRFPAGALHPVTFEIRFAQDQRASTSLLRLLTSIPSGIVLAVLWFGSGILWFVAAVIVVIGGAMPAWILGFQRGVLRWQTRLVAYHASLVDEYPPFALDTGIDEPVLATAATGP